MGALMISRYPTLQIRTPYMQDRGAEDGSVRRCQRLLIAQGFPYAQLDEAFLPIQVDGIYGPLTAAGVSAFQAARRLPATGACDQATWLALQRPAALQASSLADRLCAFARSQVGHGYVWGGKGEDLTRMSDPEGWIRRKEASSLNALRAIVFFLEAQSNRRGPVRAYDASGLILRFLQDAGLTRHAMDCRDLYRACFPRCRCDLSPGDLVFRHNGRDIFHVGVYLGDGLVCEAMGRDAGVVIRPMDASGRGYWNRYGALSLLQPSTGFPLETCIQ